MRIFLFVLIVLLPDVAKCCSCIAKYSFWQSTSSSENVYLIRIVKEKKNSKNMLRHGQTFTTVVVLDHVYGSSQVDTVRVHNGSAMDCEGSLVSQNVGDTLLMTTHSSHGYVYLPPCQINSLRYENGKVIGQITKSYRDRKSSTISFFLRFVPNFVLKMDYKRKIITHFIKNDNRYQSLSVNQIRKKLKRRYMYFRCKD